MLSKTITTGYSANMPDKYSSWRANGSRGRVRTQPPITARRATSFCPWWWYEFPVLGVLLEDNSDCLRCHSPFTHSWRASSGK